MIAAEQLSRLGQRERVRVVGCGLVQHADDDQRAQQAPQRPGVAARGRGEFRGRPRAVGQLAGQPDARRHVQSLSREVAEQHRQQRGPPVFHSGTC
jgi:hypothetical protein